MNECVRYRVSELENEWVFYVNQTAHAICRHSFRQSLDFFCFSLFVFRFSLFVFHISLFDHRSVSCCNCYLRTWIREFHSELVRKWVSECFTSIKQLMLYADVHLVKVKILFVFRFSLFVFRFSFFDNRSASCFYCLVSEYMSEWVCKWASEWVRKWVSVLRQSNSSCHMQTFISSKSRFFLFFAFRFSLFVFRFLLFVFRFSLFDHRSVSCCYCYLRTWMSECLSEWVSELVS